MSWASSEDAGARPVRDHARATAVHGRVSARQRVEAQLDRVRARTGATNAMLEVTKEAALADADRVDNAWTAGTPLPLDGFTVVLKDNIDLAGSRSTCGSRFFADRMASDDARVVTRLKDAGAVILGKAQTTEFMFSLTAHPSFPSCANPWDLTRIAGASSSGSAAAVADGQADGALGTDTGGSVRIPAAFCGVTGLRPTYGVVSTTGVFPLARSLDTVGPMARSARHVGALFDAIVGFDEADCRSTKHTPDSRDEDTRPERLRVGVPRNFFFDDCDPEIRAAVDRAIHRLAEAGHLVFEMDVPGAQQAHDDFTNLIRAEALSLHRERLEDAPDEFGTAVRDRLRLGQQLTGSDVALLVEHMHVWQRSLEVLFRDTVDVVVTPTTQCLPPTLADATGGRLPDVTRLTYPWAFGHVPALSLPVGFSGSGLPIGLQLAARRHADRLLINLAAEFQQETTWHLRSPHSD